MDVESEACLLQGTDARVVEDDSGEVSANGHIPQVWEGGKEGE